MYCDEFERRLQSTLDRRDRPEDDTRLRAHCEGCDRCRVRFEAAQRLFRGLRREKHPPLPASFSETVVARVADRAPARRADWRTWRLAAAAAAALAASWMLLLFDTGRSPQGSAAVEPAVAVATSASPPSRVDPARNREVEQVHFPVEPAADETAADAAQMREMVRRLLLAVSEVGESDSVDQIAGGLRPIADSLNVALDVLRRSWPSGRGRPQPPSNSSPQVLPHALSIPAPLSIA